MLSIHSKTQDISESLINCNTSSIVTNTSPTFTYKCIDTANSKALKSISHLLEQWQDILYSRLSASRRAKNSSDDAMSHFLQDKASVSNYKLPFDMLKSDIKSILPKKAKPQSGHKEKVPTRDIRIVMLFDKSQNIQALSSTIIKTNEVFINTLITAPWNLPMHGQIDEEHESLVSKGAGTSLMRAIYTLAQQEEKEKVTLKPTSTSKPFYEKIGMKFIQHQNNTDTDKEFFFEYSVSFKNIPKELMHRTGPVAPAE